MCNTSSGAATVFTQLQARSVHLQPLAISVWCTAFLDCSVQPSASRAGSPSLLAQLLSQLTGQTRKSPPQDRTDRGTDVAELLLCCAYAVLSDLPLIAA